MQTQPPLVPHNHTRPLAAGAFGLAAIGFLSLGRAAIDPEAGRSLDAETIAMAGLATSGAVGCLALCAAFATRERLRDALGLHKPRASLPALLMAAGGLLGLSIAAKAALVLSGSYGGSGLEVIDEALAPGGPIPTATLLLAVAIAPGFAEELLFRGFAIGSLTPRFGPGLAVLISALLFGALHVDPVHVAGAVPLGLYLGALRVVTGSTLAAIFCHVANNAFAVALAHLPGDLEGWVVAGGVLCLFPSLAWLVRRWPRQRDAPVATPHTGG